MSGTSEIEIDRKQVLAYRVAAQGLYRETSAVDDLDVLDIGVQEAMGQPAALAWAARLDADVTPVSVAVGPGHRLALAWSLRGAPNVHRRAGLDALARALYPLSEQDAQARLNENGASVARQGIEALEQFATATADLRAVVTRPTDKGTASTEVSKRLPPAMLRDCRPCRARHISDSAMRAASLAAGLELEPGTSPPVLLRRKGAKVARSPDRARLSELARAYLTVLGPATVADFAGYLDGRRADIAHAWPDDLVDVSVAGRTAQLPEELVDAVRDAPKAELVRLLGPFDPYLQARDRAVLVPDKTRHKALWPVLGRPGVVLVDGEISATWRVKTSGKKITITVEPFDRLRKADWAQLESEAERVARVRGADRVDLQRKE